MNKRFEFGQNWKNFSGKVTSQQLGVAQDSLVALFGESGLVGKSFLDIGCGSGIFSLAALELGASRVFSFDYDKKSVEVTHYNVHLAKGKEVDCFQVVQGDILDSGFLESIGEFDIVYSWGVLHHTGNMWKAISNAMSMVKPNGFLMIALYNDQGWRSKVWKCIKQIYVVLPSFLKVVILVPCFIRLWIPTFIRDLMTLNPRKTWHSYWHRRGMSPWIDVIDWVGGYPFEVAKPSHVTSFVQAQGFKLENSKLVGDGLGCNEFLFRVGS